jgi:DNA-binding response OmpR family regulator
MNTRQVRRADQEISLSAKEYEYLEYLALNRERAVRRSELLDHIYSTEYDFDSNIIDVYISNLRRKIDRDYPTKLLHTVRGVGYRLTADLDQ